jgi:flagellar motor switch protein FliM
MDDFYHKKGTLEIILGKGFISLYEAVNIKPGDIFKIDNTAGFIHTACLNNESYFYGEIVILGDYFSFRVSDNNESRGLTVETHGIVDDVCEILPSRIVLDTISVSLDELRGITKGSFIGLEKRYSLEENVELVVAGEKIADGVTVVIDENFGIKVTRVYNKPEINVPIRSSGYRVDPDSSRHKVKIYDYKRPDKFSLQEILNVENIHRLFLENLKLVIPEIKNYKTACVDQMTLVELLDSIKAEDNNYWIIETDPRPELNDIYYKASGRKPGKSVLFQEGTINPSANNKDFLKWLDTYTEVILKRRIIIATALKSPLSNIKTMENVDELVLIPLRNGWKNLANIHLKCIDINNDPEKAKIVPNNDMIITVEISDKNDPESKLIIVYPYITIEPIINLLKK